MCLSENINIVNERVFQIFNDNGTCHLTDALIFLIHIILFIHSSTYIEIRLLFMSFST